MIKLFKHYWEYTFKDSTAKITLYNEAGEPLTEPYPDQYNHLTNHQRYEGYFLTDSDLKRVAQEAFEAARASYKELDIGYEEITYITFDDYWAEQPARKGES